MLNKVPTDSKTEVRSCLTINVFNNFSDNARVFIFKSETMKRKNFQMTFLSQIE